MSTDVTGTYGAFKAAVTPGGFPISVFELQDQRIKMIPPASNPVGTQETTSRRMPDPLADIVAGCQKRDRQAQGLLYEQCKERLYRLLVRMVGQQDAPDLLQQVFLQAFLKIGQFSGRARFETWLYRLAINECLQFRRQRSRTRCDMAPDEPIDPSGDHTERAQQQELMERALARLAPELRVIFVLREVDGLSYRQIAEALDIKEGTVGSRLNQARTQLRRHLVELGWKSES
jgi:RNA polymerase sigma-70 factor, ECF subfamily